MAKITALTQDLCRFMLSQRSGEGALLAELRRETAARAPDHAGMMVSEEQGLLLRLLVAALDARLVVEVGTFTGYSAMCMASGLNDGGRVICCELDQDWPEVGRPFWERAGLAGRIDLRLGPALATLEAMPASPAIDFGFVDADKANYVRYYEALVPRTRRRGLLAFDNVMWHNWMMDAHNQDPETVGIREFNQCVLDDPRVESVMLHVGDGLTLVRRL